MCHIREEERSREELYARIRRGNRDNRAVWAEIAALRQRMTRIRAQVTTLQDRIRLFERVIYLCVFLSLLSLVYLGLKWGFYNKRGSG